MPVPTFVDKLHKASTAAALIIILLFVILGIFLSIKSSFDRHAKGVEMTKIIDNLSQIDASQDEPALKSKKFLEIAYSNWDLAAAVDARYSQNYVLNRVSKHVQSGYNVSEPLSPSVFDKAAMATCIVRVRQVNAESSTFLNDNYNAYLAAKNDLEAWRPYLADYEGSLKSCAYRFQVMHSKHVAALEKENKGSIKEIGAKVGHATSEVGRWWDNATKPLTDAVDEFKAGYTSGK
jgi:hypothetical protein